MAQVLTVMQAEENTGRAGQSGLADFFSIGPTCGAVGRDQLGLPRAPDRHADGDHHGDQAAGASNGTTRVEDMRRVSVEKEPPLEQPPRVIDRRAEKVKPRSAQA